MASDGSRHRWNIRAWFRPPGAFHSDDPDYWRAQMVHVGLLLMAFASLLISFLNFLVTNHHIMGTVTTLVFLSLIGLWRWFHRSLRLNVVAWLLVLIIMALMVFFLHQAKGGAYGMIWLTLFPPLAFFLLGKPVGFSLSAALFAYGWFHFRFNMSLVNETPFAPQSLLNLTLTFALMLFLFNFYEMTRSQAQRNLEIRQKELERLASHDQLSNLFNRRALDENLDREVTLAHRQSTPLSILLLDLDHFKTVNDRFGHQVGDWLLKETAATLKTVCRGSEIAGRWGGEEFLIICPSTDINGATILAERIRSAITQIDGPDHHRVTASIGAASLDKNESSESLLKRVDTALYAAKGNGRNQVGVA